jgi:hypothetical protein
MKRLTMVGAAALAALLLAGAFRPAWIAGDPMREAVSVEIRTLKQNPEKFVEVNVRFEGMFHSLENLWAPFFTPFVREDFMVFSVWPYDSEVWTKKGRLDDLPTCFLRKSDKQLKYLLGLKPYTPIEISGAVLSDFHKLPWIEVSAIRVLGEPRYTAEEIRAMIRSIPEPIEEPAEAAPAPTSTGKPAARKASPARAADSLQARVADLERAVAAKDTENADLRRQIDAVRNETAQLTTRCAEAEKGRREAEKRLHEKGKAADGLMTQNETLTKRVSDLEGMLRRIFGSVEAATEKLKEVEKQQKGACAPEKEPAGHDVGCDLAES